MEILILLLVGHFIPTIIALARGHHDGFAIFLTNLLLGWTVIGWVIALIWSVTAIRRPVTMVTPRA
ncbi:MAG: superinfection immunity protein [Oceanicaulis sp.]|uniref:superinfection immunity protein n=1 Tax=Glycocaulis sp. TaxID=1969725 RepID=UPI0025C33297|nr:superinfection immunity protein [Glycocaulis sp.]MCC5982209.1 superinfection immunity protein [Oceanicaulis sp.]MCH8521141.1 superinfection immunity protein [Glycocaulis sp.]